MLTLVCGAAQCDLYPEIGGSLGSWSIDGQDMLRRASADAIAAGDPLGMASFPLVPYSNRIGHARFDWNGESVTLRPNFAPEPHALHGVGWRRAWTITDSDPAAATLSLAHDGDEDWPWPFHAEQRITLTERALRLSLLVRNLADIAVPLGFGHHPYFDASGASLSFTAAQAWLNGDDQLPTQAVAPAGPYDFAGRAPVVDRDIDNCFHGLTGPAAIDWTGRPLTLSIGQSASLPVTVVYIPAGGAFFCFEPVPHLNNALHGPPSAAPMPIIAPGEWFTAEIAFGAVLSQDKGGPSESR